MHALGEALPFWSIVPFAGLLLSIAIVPQVAEHFWHKVRNQLLVALGWALPVLIGLVVLAATRHDEVGHEALHALEHAGAEYLSFIALLGSLFVISGGIHVAGDLPGRPWVNTTFLAVGAVLSNLVGTTGASMLLIRPVLLTNFERRNTWHIPLFFIFLVSNVGGSLTPIGDPPLFLGYLRGVPFFWTLVNLWAPWLFTVTVLLAMFYALDRYMYRRESPERIAADDRQISPLKVTGGINVALLLLVVASVLVLSPGGEPDDPRRFYLRELAMLGLTVLSLAITPTSVRQSNNYSWAPILEVAALFVGIFIAMIPATALLETHGSALGLSHPWQYFWATGLLSAFLDNAPTYVTFAAMACGSFDQVCATADQLGPLAQDPSSMRVMMAISLGAVFLGAGSYIGNGPNFMVRSIAQRAGYRMPSFFAYCGWALLFLGPVFVLVSLLWLR
jgi:Na+/H+ antiporter NhaD/arsenite permease-like protein